MNENKYIGLFDSGFGGISVLNHLKKLMPNENYIYLGDSKNAPFNSKSLEEQIKIADNIVKKLMEYNLKLIVIACVTMSINPNILDYLQNKYNDIHFIGTYLDFEHSLGEGVKLSEDIIRANFRTGIDIKRHTIKLLIIGTAATIKSKYVQDKVHAYSKYFDVYAEPANKIEQFVENDRLDTFECESYLEDLFSNYKDTDYLVLGCTHFPFAKDKIKAVLGDRVKIIDGCEMAAKEAYSYLLRNNLLNDDTKKGSIEIIDTLLDETRDKIYKRLIAK